MKILLIVLVTYTCLTFSFSQNLKGSLIYTKPGEANIHVDIYQGATIPSVSFGPGKGVPAYDNHSLVIYSEENQNLKIRVSVKDLRKIQSAFAREGATIGFALIGAAIFEASNAVKLAGPTIKQSISLTKRWGSKYLAVNLGFNIVTLALTSITFNGLQGYAAQENLDSGTYNELLEQYENNSGGNLLLKVFEWLNPVPEVNKAIVLSMILNDIGKAKFDCANESISVCIKNDNHIDIALRFVGAENDRYTFFQQLIDEVKYHSYQFIK